MTRVPVRITRVPYLLQPWALAMVPARGWIRVRGNAPLSVADLAHELCHITQAERHPWPLAYLTQWAATGFSYTRMPFEEEARVAERDPWYRAWAQDLMTSTTP